MDFSRSYVLYFDGSFQGLLTCVFLVFDRKLREVEVSRHQSMTGNIFSERLEVQTSDEQAHRVWTAFVKKAGSVTSHKVYQAFLGENHKVDNLILQYMRHVFLTKSFLSADYGDERFLEIDQMAKSVGREAHRMKAFVRFKLSRDQLYTANISPDFDVLPLVSKHFKDRYADQCWMIYDLKRHYGIYYDLQTVQTVELATNPSGLTGVVAIDPSEENFQQLWKDYFDSTSIASRKNMKLHLQHVPRRYWKYLSEKGGNNLFINN